MQFLRARAEWARRSLSPLRWRLTATLVVLLALFLANTGFVLAVAHERNTIRLVVQQRYNPAQIEVERLLTSLVNQESGERAYRLTLDPVFLSDYRQGQSQQAGIVTTLRRDLRSDDGALAAVQAVVKSAAEWQQHAQAEMAAGRAGRQTAAQRVDMALRGRALFDDVRAEMASFTQQVSDLQSTAASEEGDDDAALLRTVLITVITASVVVIVGLILLHRSLTRPLDELVSSIEAVKGGNLARPVAARGPSEFVQVGSAVDAMRQRMLRDASETLNRSLILVAEEQRRQLAADIHDDPTQALTAVTLRLQRLRRRLSGVDAEILADAEAAATEAVSRLRRLIFELHSPILDTEGLEAAVRVYLEETFDTAATAVELTSNGEDSLSGPVRALAYRLTRGAVLNVAKHSAASHVWVRIDNYENRLAIQIRDDGRGFDPAAVATPVPGHLGLTVSAQFAHAAGGGYRVSSAPHAGTTVDLWLPAVASDLRVG